MKGNYRAKRRWELESAAEGEAGSCTDKSSNRRGQSARLNEPAEVQNGFYHNETITLTKAQRTQCYEEAMQLCWKRKVNFSPDLQLTWQSGNSSIVDVFQSSFDAGGGFCERTFNAFFFYSENDIWFFNVYYNCRASCLKAKSTCCQ